MYMCIHTCVYRCVCIWQNVCLSIDAPIVDTISMMYGCGILNQRYVWYSKYNAYYAMPVYHHMAWLYIDIYCFICLTNQNMIQCWGNAEKNRKEFSHEHIGLTSKHWASEFGLRQGFLRLGPSDLMWWDKWMLVFTMMNNGTSTMVR